MVRGVHRNKDGEKALYIEYHLLVYDNFKNVENTHFRFALKKVFAAQNSKTVEFRFVSEINNSISRYKDKLR